MWETEEKKRSVRIGLSFAIQKLNFKTGFPHRRHCPRRCENMEVLRLLESFGADILRYEQI